MSQKERENLHRILSLVLDPANEAVRGLFELYLSLNSKSFEQFLRQHQHDIYHLCYRARCCQCRLNPHYVMPNQRVLNHEQLDDLLDKGSRLYGHIVSNTCTEFCCSPAKTNITLIALDLTLANCLLINLCPQIFWHCCLSDKNQNLDLEKLLNMNKHRLYHLRKGAKYCCLRNCPPDQELISDSQWNLMFNTQSTRCYSHNLLSENLRPVCAYQATSGIRETSVDFHTTCIIQEQLSDCRKHLKVLVNSRNEIAHLKSDTLSSKAYRDYKTKLENAILHISTICDMHDVMKEKLENIAKRSLDEQLCSDYRKVLLTEIHRNSQLLEVISDLPRQMGKKIEEVLFPLILTIDARSKNSDGSQVNRDNTEDNERLSANDVPNSEWSDDTNNNERSLNASELEPITEDVYQHLSSAVSILANVKFLYPQLGTLFDITTVTRFLCKSYKDERVRKALLRVLEENLDAEYESDKESFIQSFIFMLKIVTRQIRQSDICFLIDTMKPIKDVKCLTSLKQRINVLKKTCRRRDFANLAKYITMYTSLSFLRYISLIMYYAILDKNKSVWRESILDLIAYQMEKNKNVLKFIFKASLTTVKFNFLYAPDQYPTVEIFRDLLHFKKSNPLDFPCKGEYAPDQNPTVEIFRDTSNPLDFPREGERYTIQYLNNKQSYLFFSNVGYKWLRWSYEKTKQSIFTFKKVDKDGKTWFQIFSDVWPTYYAIMGDLEWWVRGEDEPQVDDEGLWEIIQLCDEKYASGHHVMIAPKGSKANFMTADSCGRIYGPRCNPGSDGVFKIERERYQ